MQDKMRSYTAGPGSALVATTVKKMTSLGDAANTGRLSARPLCLPCGDVSLLHLDPTPNNDMCTVVANLAGARGSNASQLGPLLDGYWAAKNTPVNESDHVGPTLASKKQPVESECHLSGGHCLCSPAGKELKKIRTNIENYMKYVMPADTPQRKDLADGYVVFLLTGRPVTSIFGDDANPDFSEYVYHFWHVSDIIFSPYVPTFQAMICQALQDDPSLALDHELLLEA